MQRNKVDIRVREGAAKPFPLGRWQHVAFVADGAVLRLYRNGVEVASLPCDGIVRGQSPIQHLAIGCQNGGEDPTTVTNPVVPWHGCIDELAIFHHALSGEQIRQLYEGPARKPTTTGHEEVSTQ